MATYPAPIKASSFNIANFITDVTGITESEANALYLQLTGNEDITGSVTFQAGEEITAGNLLIANASSNKIQFQGSSTTYGEIDFLNSSGVSQGSINENSTTGMTLTDLSSANQINLENPTNVIGQLSVNGTNILNLINSNSIYTAIVTTASLSSYPANVFTNIAAAITYIGSNGGCIFVCRGTYTIASQITLASNIMIIGESYGNVILNYTGSGGNVFYGLIVSNVILRNLTFNNGSVFFDSHTPGNSSNTYIKNIFIDHCIFNFGSSNNYMLIFGNMYIYRANYQNIFINDNIFNKVNGGSQTYCIFFLGYLNVDVTYATNSIIMINENVFNVTSMQLTDTILYIEARNDDTFGIDHKNVWIKNNTFSGNALYLKVSSYTGASIMYGFYFEHNLIMGYIGYISPVGTGQSSSCNGYLNEFYISNNTYNSSNLFYYNNNLSNQQITMNGIFHITNNLSIQTGTITLFYNNLTSSLLGSMTLYAMGNNYTVFSNNSSSMTLSYLSNASPLYLSSLVMSGSITGPDITSINSTLSSHTSSIASINTTLTTTASQTYVNTAIANLVASAPSTLNTLNELATALGDNPNFATTMTTQLSLLAPLANPTFTGVVTAPSICTNSNTSTIGYTNGSTGTTINGITGNFTTLYATNDINSNYISTKTLNLTQVGNQINLGTSGTYAITLTSGTPSAGRTYTIIDTGANSNFIMSDSSQTINGNLTLSGAYTLTAPVLISPTITTINTTLSSHTTELTNIETNLSNTNIYYVMPSIATQTYYNNYYTTIQAAINACNTAGGGIVQISNGSYTITSTLTIYSNVVIQGCGWDTIVNINFTNSNDVFDCTNTSFVVIKDIQFYTSSSYAYVNNYVFIGNCDDCLIDNVYFNIYPTASATNSKIYFGNTTTCTQTRMKIKNCLINGVGLNAYGYITNFIIEDNIINNACGNSNTYLFYFSIAASSTANYTSDIMINRNRINSSSTQTTRFQYIILNVVSGYQYSSLKYYFTNNIIDRNTVFWTYYVNNQYVTSYPNLDYGNNVYSLINNYFESGSQLTLFRDSTTPATGAYAFSGTYNFIDNYAYAGFLPCYSSTLMTWNAHTSATFNLNIWNTQFTGVLYQFWTPISTDPTSIVTPVFQQKDQAGTMTLRSSSNQLIFLPMTASSVGSDGNSITITTTNPSASRIYTLPDTGANSNFIMTDTLSSQTINGNITINNLISSVITTINSNITNINTSISTINTALTLLAPIATPIFTTNITIAGSSPVINIDSTSTSTNGQLNFQYIGSTQAYINANPSSNMTFKNNYGTGFTFANNSTNLLLIDVNGNQTLSGNLTLSNGNLTLSTGNISVTSSTTNNFVNNNSSISIPLSIQNTYNAINSGCELAFLNGSSITGYIENVINVVGSDNSLILGVVNGSPVPILYLRNSSLGILNSNPSYNLDVTGTLHASTSILSPLINSTGTNTIGNTTGTTLNGTAATITTINGTGTNTIGNTTGTTVNCSVLNVTTLYGTNEINSNYISTKTLNLTQVGNQINLGTSGTYTITLTSGTPAANRTYTIPDTGANSTFLMTDSTGTQTITTGNLTITTGNLTISKTTNQLTLYDTTINAVATSARTYTLPDYGQNSSIIGSSLNPSQTNLGYRIDTLVFICTGSWSMGTSSIYSFALNSTTNPNVAQLYSSGTAYGTWTCSNTNYFTYGQHILNILSINTCDTGYLNGNVYGCTFRQYNNLAVYLSNSCTLVEFQTGAYVGKDLVVTVIW